MVTRTGITLEEFLAMPETEPPSELVDGEVVPRVAPSWNHSDLVGFLYSRLAEHLRKTGAGRAGTEVRHVSRSEQRSYLPDVHVTLKERLPADPEAFRRGPVEVAPDFAIEVLSPDDRPMRVLDRLDFYRAAGVRLVWVVDPESRTVRVDGSEATPGVHRAPGTITAAPVLPGFEADLDELFASMSR